MINQKNDSTITVKLRKHNVWATSILSFQWPSQNFCGYDLKPSQWEKIFANEATEKELISKI